jgi:hypothetical protein
MTDHAHGSNAPASAGAAARPERDSSHARPRREDCISACSTAHDECMAGVAYCLQAGGELAAARHIRTLLDAAQASEVARDFLLRGSKLYKLYCRGCAHACEEAAKACERFGNDEVMRTCAKACRRCVEACREVGGAHREHRDATSHA